METQHFDDFKKGMLLKIEKFDKSRAGQIDKDILNFIKSINKTKNFYTSSSCSGRIMVIIPGKKKYMADWLFFTHDIVYKSEARKLYNYLDFKKKDMWLKMEPAIFHIVARKIEDAQNFVKISKEANFKNSVLFEFNKKLLIQIMGNDLVQSPLYKMSFDDFYFIIRKCNEKLKIAKKANRLLEKKVKDGIKRSIIL